MLFLLLHLTYITRTISRSLHAAANGTILLLFMPEQYFITCLYRIFFIPSSVDGHFGCVHVLAVVNSAAINMGVHVSF